MYKYSGKNCCILCFKNLQVDTYYKLQNLFFENILFTYYIALLHKNPIKQKIKHCIYKISNTLNWVKTQDSFYGRTAFKWLLSNEILLQDSKKVWQTANVRGGLKDTFAKTGTDQTKPVSLPLDDNGTLVVEQQTQSRCLFLQNDPLLAWVTIVWTCSILLGLQPLRRVRSCERWSFTIPTHNSTHYSLQA